MKRTERRGLSDHWGAVVLAFGFTCAALAGCDRKREGPPPVPAVTVAEVTQQTIPVYLEYVGTTEAVRSVDIRARVEGFLQRRAFTEGADVKEGDLLFIIDPSPYQAQLESAMAQLAKDEAALAYAQKQVERYRPLLDKEFVTREAFEQFRTKAEEAAAAVAGDRAAVKQAGLNLSYCTMRAPLNGRIGEAVVKVGNLVGPGQNTVLARIVQLDPIYVYFSASERELPQMRKQQEREELLVTAALPDESTHPHRGRVDFFSNTVDPLTATIKLRAVVPNPGKTLLPGQYARVRLLLGNKPDALLIPERAIQQDQGGASVFVVSQDNRVQGRGVVVGAAHQGMRVIERGVTLGERVIIEGLQKVRPGMEVQPKLTSPGQVSTLTPASPRLPPGSSN